jgi:hypothetical protein
VPVRTSDSRDLRVLPFRGTDAIRRGLIASTALSDPAWRRLMPDIYVAADADLDHRTWCYAAAHYTAPRGAIAGASAAYLHGVDLHPAEVDVWVPTDLRFADVPHVRIDRSPLPSTHVTMVAGIRVTTPARTAFDLARRLPIADAVVAIDAMCCGRSLRLADLTEFASLHREWPGGAQVATVLSLIEPLSESPRETLLRLALVGGGLPRPIAQHEIRVQNHFVGRLDLAYPQWKIGIEPTADKRRPVGTEVAREDRLAAAGWTVLKFDPDEVTQRPAAIVAAIKALTR